MLLTTTPYLDGMIILQIQARRLRSDLLPHIDRACDLAKAEGRNAILFDMSKVRRANVAAISALVEVISRHPQMAFALCGVSETVQRSLAASGLDRHIAVFASALEAARAPSLARFALCRTQAILIINPSSNALAEATLAHSPSVLDVLGRPLMCHILDQLHAYGIDNIIIEATPETRRKIEAVLAPHPTLQNLFFTERAAHSAGQNRADLLQASQSLSPIAYANANSDRQVLLVATDSLFRLDLATMMQSHLSTGNQMTLATTRGLAEATTESEALRVSPVLIARGAALACREASQKAVFSHPEMPRKLGRAWAPNIFQSNMKNAKVETVKDYCTALHLAGKKIVTRLPPVGEEIEQGVWRAQGAKISPKSRLSGFLYAGAASVIGAYARLSGVNILGTQTAIETHSYLDNCLLLPRTRVSSGAQMHNRILSPKLDLDVGLNAPLIPATSRAASLIGPDAKLARLKQGAA